MVLSLTNHRLHFHPCDRRILPKLALDLPLTPARSAVTLDPMNHPDSRHTLPRVLGLWTAVALVIGGTIGTGVS